MINILKSENLVTNHLNEKTYKWTTSGRRLSPFQYAVCITTVRKLHFFLILMRIYIYMSKIIYISNPAQILFMDIFNILYLPAFPDCNFLTFLTTSILKDPQTPF